MEARKMLVFVLMLGFLSQVYAQKSLPLQYVFAGDVPAGFLTPSKVSSLVGRDSQTDPTWGIIETPGGDSILSSGYVKLVQPDTSKKYFTCSVNEFKFVLLKNDFVMKGDVLFDLFGNKQEALLLEFDSCLCANKTKIKYSKSDSLAKNINLPIKRVLKDVEVKPKSFYPSSISAHAVDSVSRRDTYRYLLVPVLKDGTSCTMFWLQRELREGLVTEVVYELYYADSRMLTFDGDRFFLQGKPVDHFDVVEEVDMRLGGAKNFKYNNRVRR